MAYGMEILQDSGALWMSPDVTPMNHIDTITQPIANGTVFQSSVPQNKQAMFFVSYDANGVCAFQEGVTNGFRSLTVERFQDMSVVTVYVFANMAIRRSDYGIFMFNGAGELTYSADMRPLQIQTATVSVAGDGVNVDVGQPCAVLPTFSGRTTQPNSGVGGFNIFNYYTGSTGNSVTNRRIQIGITSGPAGFTFSTTAFYIFTNMYN